MRLARKLLGMFLVALGDFASGLLIAHILIKTTAGNSLPAVPLIIVYALGTILAVLPDIDIALHRFAISSKPEDISDHREMLHKPLFIIPIFAFLYVFSPFWAYLTGLCLLAHFVHDSTGSGYGVKWFLPFSDRTYKLCRKNLICSWTAEEVRKNPWKPTLDEWLEEYYLKPTPEGLFGIILAIFAIIVIAIW